MDNPPPAIPPQSPTIQPQKPSQEPPVIKPTEEKPKNKLVPLLVFLLLVALGVAGYFGWQNYQLKLKQEVADVQPEPSPEVEVDETAEWEIYKNTKHGYEIKYPSDFEIVKGPVSETELSTLDNISFSGKQKPQDSNSGVVFGLNASPTDVNGVALTCSDNDSCLNAWMRVLGKTSNEVNSVSTNILGIDRKGFEYINQNPLYTQRHRYFVFPYKNKIWEVNLTINNFSDAETQEMNLLFDKILSAFKFVDDNNKTLFVSLDEEFTLHENQSAIIESENYEIKITEFSNSPCPDEVVCVWGGVGIHFEYTYKGEIEKGTNIFRAFGYRTSVIETDYETFAILKITKIE